MQQGKKNKYKTAGREKGRMKEGYHEEIFERKRSER